MEYDIKKIMLEQMELYLQGECAKHIANVHVYMHNPAGIGEHSDVMEAIEEELGKAVDAKDKLEMLKSIFKGEINE